MLSASVIYVKISLQYFVCFSISEVLTWCAARTIVELQTFGCGVVLNLFESQKATVEFGMRSWPPFLHCCFSPTIDRPSPMRRFSGCWVRRSTTCFSWSVKTQPSVIKWSYVSYSLRLYVVSQNVLTVNISKCNSPFLMVHPPHRSSLSSSVSLWPPLFCFLMFANSCPLSQEWEQRQEEDNLLIERILLLVRNILHVPADPYEEKVREKHGHVPSH